MTVSFPACSPKAVCVFATTSTHLLAKKTRTTQRNLPSLRKYKSITLSNALRCREFVVRRECKIHRIWNFYKRAFTLKWWLRPKLGVYTSNLRLYKNCPPNFNTRCIRLVEGFNVKGFKLCRPIYWVELCENYFGKGHESHLEYWCIKSHGDRKWIRTQESQCRSMLSLTVEVDSVLKIVNVKLRLLLLLIRWKQPTPASSGS